VRLAYDQDKYGRKPPVLSEQTLIKSFKREELPEVTIKPYTPGQDTRTVEEIYEGTKPKSPEPAAPSKETKPMERTLLIATARGHAATLGTKDAYFAWLLTELADQLEKDTPINLAED
jgi:hypothetical protein